MQTEGWYFSARIPSVNCLGVAPQALFSFWTNHWPSICLVVTMWETSGTSAKNWHGFNECISNGGSGIATTSDTYLVVCDWNLAAYNIVRNLANQNICSSLSGCHWMWSCWRLWPVGEKPGCISFTRSLSMHVSGKSDRSYRKPPKNIENLPKAQILFLGNCSTEVGHVCIHIHAH